MCGCSREGTVVMDDALSVAGSTTLTRLNVQTTVYSQFQSITETGTVNLSVTPTCYRVDTASGTVDLFLPTVASTPGLVYQLAKSVLGAAATVTLNVSGSDQLCSLSSCTASNPVYTFPSHAAQITLMNDGVNVWFFKS
jgi:hypothetical protein